MPAADTLVLSEFSRINPGAFRNYLNNVRLRKTAFTPTAAFSASSSGDPPGKRSPSQLVKKFASHSDRDLYFETSAAATDFLSRKEGADVSWKHYTYHGHQFTVWPLYVQGRRRAKVQRRLDDVPVGLRHLRQRPYKDIERGERIFFCCFHTVDSTVRRLWKF